MNINQNLNNIIKKYHQYSATDCKGKVHKGNDGELWLSGLSENLINR